MSSEKDYSKNRWEFTQRFYGKKIIVHFDNGKELECKLLNVATDGLMVELDLNLGEAFVPWDSMMWVQEKKKPKEFRE